MKKLLFLIPTLQGGGAEKVLVDLVNNLDASKYDVTVMTFLAGGTFEKRLLCHIKLKRVITLQNELLRRIVSYLIFFIIPPKIVYSLIVREHYDIEIAYLQGAPTVVIGSSRNNRSRKIAFVHSDFSSQYNVGKYYKDTNQCLENYKKFDKVCFVSQKSYDGFKKKVGSLNNYQVIHNVCDYTFIREKALVKPRELNKKECFRIISVGRLIGLKGFDRLLEATAKLQKQGFDYELLILGDGPERENLENIIYNNKLINVKLLGFRENPYPYIASSDLFVCSSTTEGFSTVVKESITLGIPVLTTDCAGMDEILENGELGLIVENSTNGIFSGLKMILENENIYKNYLRNTNQHSKNLAMNHDILKYDELLGFNK